MYNGNLLWNYAIQYLFISCYHESKNISQIISVCGKSNFQLVDDSNTVADIPTTVAKIESVSCFKIQYTF